MRVAPFLSLCLAASLLAAPARPRLVVVISVDQFSAELMARWGRDLPGGLGRLWREGTTFVDAYQDHGHTETGPGHSVLLTGLHPMHTGIIENDWLDRDLGRSVYCVEDPKGLLVDAQGTPVGPAHLSGATLGERLTDQVKGSRSFAVAGKDRAAILMAGHRAQGVYWFTGGSGFTTSQAYAQTLPGWLKSYNAAFLERTANESLFWSALDERGLPPAATYTIQGRSVTMALPRAIHAVGMPMDTAFWGRFRTSPFFDEAILGAAEALIAGEHLGEGPSVDLLALGLSATDYIGHAYGNGGPEMLDQVRRLDRALGAFLDRLQAKDPWVVLTADHGAADFPERLQAQGLRAAQRLDARAWSETFNQTLTRRLGGTRPYLALTGVSEFHLVEAALDGHTRAQVLEAAVAVAKAMPEVAEACSADELRAFAPDPGEAPDRRSLKAKLRLSFFPGRSGDLLVAFRPFLIPGGDVANHGAPYDYDRRVPLVFRGPWRTEQRSEPVRLVDLEPTLAHELGLDAGAVDGRVLVLKAK